MSNKKIVKTLKKGKKSGSIIPIPQPPQNFVGATSLQDSNALLENPAGVLSGVEQSQVVTKVSKQLLAQLQSANLIVQAVDASTYDDIDETPEEQVEDASTDAMNHEGSYLLPTEDSNQQILDSENQGQNLSQAKEPSNMDSTADGVDQSPVVEELENNFVLQHGGISLLANELLDYGHPHSDQCCSVCKITLSLILRMVTEINERLNNIPLLLNSNQPHSVLQNDNNHILPKFPIKKRKQLEEFDKQLDESDDVKSAFRQEISKIGGKNPQKGTKVILDHLLTNKIAAKSSWTGIHGGVKIKDTAFVKILTDFLVSKYGSSHAETKDKVEDRIKDWFQRGSDRLKAEEKKIKHKSYGEFFTG